LAGDVVFCDGAHVTLSWHAHPIRRRSGFIVLADGHEIADVEWGLGRTSRLSSSRSACRSPNSPHRRCVRSGGRLCAG
jgi:hypothetical protein